MANPSKTVWETTCVNTSCAEYATCSKRAQGCLDNFGVEILYHPFVIDQSALLPPFTANTTTVVMDPSGTRVAVLPRASVRTKYREVLTEAANITGKSMSFQTAGRKEAGPRVFGMIEGITTDGIVAVSWWVRTSGERSMNDVAEELGQLVKIPGSTSHFIKDLLIRIPRFDIGTVLINNELGADVEVQAIYPGGHHEYECTTADGRQVIYSEFALRNSFHVADEKEEEAFYTLQRARREAGSTHTATIITEMDEWRSGEADAKAAGIVSEGCPKCGGVADNGHDRENPPNMYVCRKCETLEELAAICSDANMERSTTKALTIVLSRSEVIEIIKRAVVASAITTNKEVIDLVTDKDAEISFTKVGGTPEKREHFLFHVELTARETLELFKPEE